MVPHDNEIEIVFLLVIKLPGLFIAEIDFDRIRTILLKPYERKLKDKSWGPKY
jgi:hypothetical protein